MAEYDSILDGTKKALGLAPDYDVFDPDIIMHINSVFSTLNQLGLGPEEGFRIENADATWDTFLGDNQQLNSVKTYVYLRVRLIFDPPTTSFVMEALKEQLREYEWRFNVYRENRITDVSNGTLTDPQTVDGGVI